MNENTKLLIGSAAATAAIVAAARERHDMRACLYLLLGFGLAQWIVTDIHYKRYK